MKIIGAKIIGFGIIMLAFGMVGLQLRLFWFLDAFGPAVAVGLKLGVIALGIWIWRNADRGAAVEDDVTDEESRRAWLPVAMAGALIFGIIAFVVANSVRDARLEKQIAHDPAPAAWASVPPSLWPDVTLVQKAKFVHHSSLEAGCACLVRLPTGEICALTAGHLLGQAGGVSPGFTLGVLGGLDKYKLATLNSEITSWKLFPPNAENLSINVAGLYGEAGQLDERGDQVLLRLAPGTNDYPVTPLDLRLSQVAMGEPLRVLTYTEDDDGNVQQVVNFAQRAPGIGFTCILPMGADLDGFSGSPIVDTNGLLVAIVTGASMMDRINSPGHVRSFIGHPVTELMPVLKEAVAKKGTVALMPLKSVTHNAVKSDSKTPVVPLRNTI
jgi:hypothetical protein